METAADGKAQFGVEFYDAAGKMIDELFSPLTAHPQKNQLKFRFSTLPDFSSARLLCFSGGKGEVRFSQVSCVELLEEIAEIKMPFEATPLPAAWNERLTGIVQFSTFDDASVPLAFDLKGQRKLLKNPAIIIELPEA